MSRPTEGPDGINLGDMGPPPEDGQVGEDEDEFNEPDNDQEQEPDLDDTVWEFWTGE